MCTAAATDFSCAFSGYQLTVTGSGDFWYYSVTTSQGSAWLKSDPRGASLSLLHNGAFLTPGEGLTGGAPALGMGVDELGAFSYLSVPWAPSAPALDIGPFFANFTCYHDRTAAALSLHFPGGWAFGGSLGADAAARFPLFYAPGNSSLLSELGFVEWAGEMDSYNNNHGVGLQGYGGGTQSGPLLLFNASELVPGASKPHALVLGPGGGAGTHVAHGVLNLLPAAGAEAATDSDCDPTSWAPHTDEMGAHPAPGFEGGVMVAAGQPGACCAKCAAAGLSVCDSWVYDTDGTAGGANCWPLQGITGSKQVGDRTLGLMFATKCEAPAPEAAPATSAPSDGFNAGVGNSTPAACCAVCGALGPACAAWVFDAPTATCFPLKTASGGSAPAPGKAWARKAAPPKWLAAGVQGEIALLPPRFTSKWLLVGSATGINDAVMAYGSALKDAAPGGGRKLRKEDDAMRNLLTYYSDNGAFYFDGALPSSLATQPRSISPPPPPSHTHTHPTPHPLPCRLLAKVFQQRVQHGAGCVPRAKGVPRSAGPHYWRVSDGPVLVRWRVRQLWTARPVVLHARRLALGFQLERRAGFFPRRLGGIGASAHAVFEPLRAAPRESNDTVPVGEQRRGRGELERRSPLAALGGLR